MPILRQHTKRQTTKKRRAQHKTVNTRKIKHRGSRATTSTGGGRKSKRKPRRTKHSTKHSTKRSSPYDTIVLQKTCV